MAEIQADPERYGNEELELEAMGKGDDNDEE